MSLSPKLASEEEFTAATHGPEEEIREGSLVEVTFEEEGFKGSWYEAKILTLPEDKDKGKALIQYTALMKDEKSTDPLTESAFLSFMRPLPPQPEPDQVYEVGDVVDAFFRDGWWVGSVTEVLEEKKRFSVFFEDPPHEIGFSPSDLRAHLDWVDGKWVKPQKKEVSRPIIDSLSEKKRKPKKIGNQVSPVAGKEDNTLLIVTTPMMAEEVGVSADAALKVSKHNVNSSPGKKRKLKKGGNPVFPVAGCAGMEENTFQIVPMPRTPEEVSVKTTLKVLKNNVNSLPGKKRKLVKGGKPVSPVAGKDDDQPQIVIMTDKLEEGGFSVKATKVSKYNVKTVTTKKQKLQKCAIPLSPMAAEENAFQIVAVPRKPVEVGFSVNTSKETERVTHSVPMKKRKLKKCDNSAPPVAGKKYNALQIVALPYKTEEDGFSTNATSEEIPRHNGHVTTSTRLRKEVYARRQSQIKKKKQPQTVCDQTKKKQPQTVSDQTKKKQPQTECDIFKPVALDVPQPALFKNPSAGQVELPTVSGLASAEGCPRSQAKEKQPQIVFESGKPSVIGVPQRILFQELATKQIGLFTDSGLEPPCSKTTEAEIVPTTACNTKENGVASAGKDCVMEEVQIILEDINTSLVNEKDSRSETATVEVIAATDCNTRDEDLILTRKDSSVCPNEQPSSVCVKEVQSPPLVSDSGNDKMVAEDVVFVKESPLWKEIETFKVFQAIPQKPHFRPLLQTKEAMREGVALGRMITFETLVDKASKLEIKDPINRFTYILDSLPDLESHGFHVASVKLRVEKLKSLKESQQHLVEKSKASASKCADHSQGLTEIEKDIEEIDVQMKCLREKKAMLVSKKDKKVSDFAKAREEAEGCNQRIKYTREEFARVAASPW